MSLWTIREVTRMTGATESALRYYKDKGVLAPTVIEETGRKRWLYDDTAVSRLKRLLLLKYAGLSIENAGSVIDDDELFQKAILNHLRELKKQRDALDIKIYLVQTLAISGGYNPFAPDEEFEDPLEGMLIEVMNDIIASRRM